MRTYVAIAVAALMTTSPGWARPTEETVAAPVPSASPPASKNAPKAKKKRAPSRRAKARAQARAAKRTAGKVAFGELGVGGIAGDPIAATARYWFSDNLAGQAHLGYALQHGGIYGSADAVYGWREVASLAGLDLDITAGGGIAIGSAAGLKGFHVHSEPWIYGHRNDDPARLLVALRAPVGMSLWLSKAPIELFAEVAPGFLIVPSPMKTSKARNGAASASTAASACATTSAAPSARPPSARKE